MSRHRLVVGLAAIAALGISCEDDVTPPALPNPNALAVQLTQFKIAVDFPAMRSFGALAVPLKTVGANVANLATVLQGKTLEWNPTIDGLNATARVGAPANATRVILYSINLDTRRPVLPLVELGYVDLFAHSDFPDSSSIRYVVVSDSSTVPGVLADFLAHAHDNPGDTARVEGFVTNGTHRLDFASVYRAAPGQERILVGTFDLASPAARVRHRFSLPPAGDTAFTSEVSLLYEGDSVRSVSLTTASASGNITSQRFTSVNGIDFAEETITTSGATSVGPGGRQLTTDEYTAVAFLGSLSQDLALYIQRPILMTYQCGC